MIIEVRAHAGRVAYSAAHNGRLIPQDKFIKAEMSSWLRRLRDVHGDVEIRRVEKVKAAKMETVDDRGETLQSVADTALKQKAKGKKK